MQLTINSTELMNTLNTLKPAVATRSSLDIIRCVLIVAKEGRVWMDATNLEVHMRVDIEGATIAEDGEVAVNYTRLIEVAKTLPKKSSITLTTQENKLLVKGPGRTTTMETMQAGDFPYVPARIKPQQQVTLPCKTLVDMVARVALAAATDDSRPVLTGIYTELKDDTLTMVGADSFWMAMQETTLPGSGSWDAPLLIPAKYLNDVAKALPKKSTVTIQAELQPLAKDTVQRVALTSGNVQVVIRLIEGTFPNYRCIVPNPRDYKTHVTANTKDLLLAVKAVASVAKVNSNQTRLTIQEEMLVVEAKNDDSEERQELPIDLIGEEMRVIYNNRYLQDILKATHSTQVSLQITTPTRPSRWAPLDDKARYQFILMPMSVNR